MASRYYKKDTIVSYRGLWWRASLNKTEMQHHLFYLKNWRLAVQLHVKNSIQDSKAVLVLFLDCRYEERAIMWRFEIKKEERKIFLKKIEIVIGGKLSRKFFLVGYQKKLTGQKMKNLMKIEKFLNLFPFLGNPFFQKLSNFGNFFWKKAKTCPNFFQERKTTNHLLCWLNDNSIFLSKIFIN